MASLTVRRALVPWRTYTQLGYLHYSTQSVVQASFWKGLVPKPLRRSPAHGVVTRSKEWNPATFFISIFVLIGSMSIQMIALRTELGNFTRRTDARIGLLKEVIGRIQKGEQVDVEKLLGSGEAQQEREWAEVLEQIEHDKQTNSDAKPAPLTQEPKATPTQEPSRTVNAKKTFSGYH